MVLIYSWICKSESVGILHRRIWLQCLWHDFELWCWLYSKSIILHGSIPIPLHNSLWILWKSQYIRKGKSSYSLISMSQMGSKWISMGIGYPGISLGIKGYPWISMCLQGSTWVTVMLYGSPRASVKIHGPPGACRGLQGLPGASRGLQGPPGTSRAPHGSPWIFKRHLYSLGLKQK